MTPTKYYVSQTTEQLASEKQTMNQDFASHYNPLTEWF